MEREREKMRDRIGRAAFPMKFKRFLFCFQSAAAASFFAAARLALCG